MRTFSLRRLAVVLAAGAGALLVASPASANTTVNINPGNVPATANGHDCSDAPFANLPDGRNGWLFVLPDGGAHGVFTSLHLTFSNGVSVDISASGASGANGVTGGLLPIGNNSANTTHAWLITPTGWTLTAGSAVVTAGSFFVLSHTCVGGASARTPTPTTSTSSGRSGGGSSSSSGGSGGGGNGGGSSSGGSLPITGGAVGGIVVVGVLLLACGVALVLLRRRRDVTFLS